mmetsp:Transcript_45946/g.127516  ORF Transcript_45946/g.127516 Transcript_45946/m.127516 type:complete len:513 (-) Transcript_45946:88-1626(-)
MVDVAGLLRTTNVSLPSQASTERLPYAEPQVCSWRTDEDSSAGLSCQLADGTRMNDVHTSNRSLVAREPPREPPASFDREDLDEVLVHLSDFEALPCECFRALRALASLAYADAAHAANDSRIVPLLVRLSALHADDERLQRAISHVFAHLAFDMPVASAKLSETRVCKVLLGVMARFPSAGAGAHASEAMARIVAADAKTPEEQDSGETPMCKLSNFALQVFFDAACRGGNAWQVAASAFVARVVANDVVQPMIVAKSFVAAKACDGLVGTDGFAEASRPELASAWLRMAWGLVDDSAGFAAMQRALVDAGILGSVMRLMELHVSVAAVQTEGVAAIAALVQHRQAAIQVFAAAGGTRVIEAAMGQHTGDVHLQTAGILFLVGCLKWPRSVQEQARYASSRAVDLTKTAMAHNVDCVRLQAVALEALGQYLAQTHCHRLVKIGGGEGLVKVVMARHADDEKVQTWGRVVLDAIGVNRFWVPKGIAVAIVADEETDAVDTDTEPHDSAVHGF